MSQQGYKPIGKLNLGKLGTDAIAYMGSGENRNDMFNRLFVTTKHMKKIENNEIYFIIGDKGSGKTAYAVHTKNNNTPKRYSEIITIANTDFNNFLSLKSSGPLNVASYHDIWELILLYNIAHMASTEEPMSNHILQYRRLSAIKEVMKKYYDDKFVPDLNHSIRFIENRKEMVSLILKILGSSLEISHETTSEKPRYFIDELKRQFTEALSAFRPTKDYILFIDRTDDRPGDVAQPDYLEFIGALAQTVLRMNQTFFADKNKRHYRLIMLVRPDIFANINIHNKNCVLTDNSVLLDWNTKYDDYRKSELFEMANRIFCADQENYSTIKETKGEAWDHYFPFKIKNLKDKTISDDPFVDFLRQSFYRPRDIITRLKILAEIKQENEQENEQFVEGDIIKNEKLEDTYSQYLLREVEDQFQINRGIAKDKGGFQPFDFTMFRRFFVKLEPKAANRRFSYEDYCSVFEDYIKSLVDRGDIKEEEDRQKILSDRDEFLQLLYSLNIIAYFSQGDDNTEGAQYWHFRERSANNIYPEVVPGKHYVIHHGIARALGFES